MVMAEKEQSHRLSLDERGQIARINETKRGNYMGFTLSSLAMLGAIFCAWQGLHWSVSLALLSLPVMATVRALIKNRSDKPKA